MRSINVLLKPASSACNMDCKYCFYKSVSASRETPFTGMMSFETLECVVRKVLDAAESGCGFAFQGGEPTLAGLDYYRHFIELVKRYNTRNIRVSCSIQTNGYVIDKEWAEFFNKNSFLVGLSIDGCSEVHNQNRIDNFGKPTFNTVMKAARFLKEYKVDFNILSVVTGPSARHVTKNYEFLKRQGFRHLQFIPYLEPQGSEKGSSNDNLSPLNYSIFLSNLFDLWYRDLIRDDYVSIRHFENLVGMMKGLSPESCNMSGACTCQYVIEGDGGVYPCDFYVLDSHRLGNINTDSLKEMFESGNCQTFITSSAIVPDKCRNCRFHLLCRNGCRRDRVHQDGDAPLNYYCDANREFFARTYDRLLEISGRLI